MRRLIVERPIRLARASRFIATFALYVTMIAAALVRFRLVEVRPGLAALGAGLALAGLAILIAIAAFAVIWRTGRAGAGRAFAGFLIACAILTLPAYTVAHGMRRPPLNDITTDTVDPPVFTAAARERPADANATAYPAGFGPLQHAAYPTIHSLLVDLSPEDVHGLVLALAKERRWRIAVDMPLSPAGEGRAPMRFAVGRVEAVARSLVLGLEDDIAIRLRDEGGRTRVDMRSASRYGHGDFGVNAARVETFLEDLRVRALNPAQPPGQ